MFIHKGMKENQNPLIKLEINKEERDLFIFYFFLGRRAYIQKGFLLQKSQRKRRAVGTCQLLVLHEKPSSN